ncbi:MAG: hypothetical protein U0X87_04825 [Anaerolineales bacterium]
MKVLNERVGARVYLKCENFQKVGAFKFRGACNAVYSLSDDEAKHGLHALIGKSRAGIGARGEDARHRGAYRHAEQCSASEEGCGGWLRRQDHVLQADARSARKHAGRIRLDTGANVVHPYNDERVIAGQGTASLELLADSPDLNAIIAPSAAAGC